MLVDTVSSENDKYENNKIIMIEINGNDLRLERW
jgi:mRNA-degrading endonuclease HigB of HigAB toxin-antitoxin module